MKIAGKTATGCLFPFISFRSNTFRKPSSSEERGPLAKNFGNRRGSFLFDGGYAVTHG
jgi:hypothetical protein